MPREKPRPADRGQARSLDPLADRPGAASRWWLKQGLRSLLALCLHRRKPCFMIQLGGVQMATITVRNLPPELVKRVKESAAKYGRSMEQEIRDLIEQRYRRREDVLLEARARWEKLPRPSAEEVDAWIETGRR